MLHWIEGFEGFGDVGSVTPSGIVASKYNATESGMLITSGRLSGYALRFDTTSATLSKILSITNNTMVIGMAVWFQTVNATAAFLSLYYSAILGINFRYTAVGDIYVYNGSSTYKGSIAAGLAPDTWYYLEFKVVTGQTGSVEIRKNGNTVGTLTSIDTRPNAVYAYHNGFSFPSLYNNNNDVYYDDLYVLDGASGGNPPNNDFLGDMRVVAIRPDSAGDVTQWAPFGAASNYECVYEEKRDGDTKYVYETVDGEQDLYGYAALSGVASDIRGIQINTDARKTDAGDTFNLNTLVKPSGGSVSSDNPGQGLGLSYAILSRVVASNPGDNEAWEVADINAAQFGIELNIP